LPANLEPLEEGRCAEIRETVFHQDQPSPDFHSMGQELHDWLIGNDVGRAWLCIDQQPGLRTVLCIEDEELRAIPWELMCRGNLPLFARQNNPIVRGRVPNDHREPESIEWPLRVLLVDGAPAAQGAGERIYSEVETESIQRVFHQFRRMVEPVILRRPSRERLDDVLDSLRPHIIHFIGHGREYVGSGIVLTIDADQPWDWRVQEITAKFDPQTTDWQPRFVLLNACRSSGHIDEQGHASSVARAFADAGIPAVLGMQADILGDVAARLSVPFYRSLLEGTPIDQSLCKARHEVVENLQKRDWCLPHLELNTLPDRVFPVKPPIDPELRQRVRNIPEFQEHSRFVDRENFRSNLRKAIQPVDGSLPRPVTIISGAREVGKSALLHYCLEWCVYWDWRVAFADTNREGNQKSFLDTLELLAKGNPECASLLSPNHTAAEPDAFSDYLEAVDDFRQSAAGELNDTARWNGPTSEAAHRVVKTFGDAFQSAAVDRVSILAIDHVNIIDDHFRILLLPGLLQRINQGSLSRVRVIMVIEPGNSDYAPPSLIAPNEIVNVTGFEHADFARCVREYFLDSEVSRDDPEGVASMLPQLINARQQRIAPRWPPSELTELEQILVGLLRKG